MEIVFDGELEVLAFHDPLSGEVQLLTLGVGAEGFAVELGEEALLAVDEDDAFAELTLRRRERADDHADPALDASAPAAPPEADLAEAEWPLERGLVWSLDGAVLNVAVLDARPTQWARIGRTQLYVALDLATPGEAFVAGLQHRDVVEDPGGQRRSAALLRLGDPR